MAWGDMGWLVEPRGHRVAGGCGGGQQCPRRHGWSERSRGTQVVPRGTPVVPRDIWSGCSCHGDGVVASSDRGTQEWPGECSQQWPALLRGAGDGQGCHEDTVRGWQCPRGHGCLQKTWSNWHHSGLWGWLGLCWGAREAPPHHPPCPQEELQAWLQGLSAAITECRGSRGKVQSLPLPIPPAPPEAPLPRKDKEKRFSFFPKKK